MFVVSSCKKDKDCNTAEYPDDSPDTVKVHSYIPAYPDSWWKYSDSSLVTVNSELSALDYKYQNNPPCPDDISIQRTYVPVVGDSAIQGNVRFHYGSSPTANRRIQMFSTNGDTYWETEGPTPDKLWLLDSTLTITVDDVLYENVKVVRMENWYSHSTGPDTYHYVDTTYFADSVGIIKSVLYKTYPTTELVYDRELVDYYINF